MTVRSVLQYGLNDLRTVACQTLLHCMSVYGCVETFMYTLITSSSTV
jgi:hypothetical protein